MSQFMSPEEIIMYEGEVYDDTKSYDAIRKIAGELRTTETTQIKGALSKFDDEDQLIGKCALGVLTCKFYEKLTSEHPNGHVDDSEIEYCDILLASGIECEFIEDLPNEWDEDNSDLSGVICHLNDRAQLTFKEIADYLETTFIPEENN